MNLPKDQKNVRENKRKVLLRENDIKRNFDQTAKD